MRLVTTPRVELLRELRQEFLHNYPLGRRIIAVDGFGGTGTANFADALAEVFEESDVPAFRASIDDFHRPREDRYRRGRDSAEGYYLDSFNYSVLRRVLTEPFRMGGSTGFQLSGFDEPRDISRQSRWVTSPQDAVLIIDGVFLLRPELSGIWNWAVHVDAPLEISYSRLAAQLRVNPNPAAPDNARYVGGQKLYLAETQPRQVANAIIDNADEAHPRRIFSDGC